MSLTLFPLALLSRPIPFELFAHDVDDTRQTLKRRLGVEEGEARASGQDVHGRLSVLVPNGVPDLTVHEWVQP